MFGVFWYILTSRYVLIVIVDVFQGFFPAFVRLGPQTILTFMLFEQLRLNFGYVKHKEWWRHAIERFWDVIATCNSIGIVLSADAGTGAARRFLYFSINNFEDLWILIHQMLWFLIAYNFAWLHDCTILLYVT